DAAAEPAAIERGLRCRVSGAGECTGAVSVSGDRNKSQRGATGSNSPAAPGRRNKRERKGTKGGKRRRPPLSWTKPGKGSGWLRKAPQGGIFRGLAAAEAGRDMFLRFLIHSSFSSGLVQAKGAFSLSRASVSLHRAIVAQPDTRLTPAGRVFWGQLVSGK